MNTFAGLILSIAGIILFTIFIKAERKTKAEDGGLIESGRLRSFIGLIASISAFIIFAIHLIVGK